VRLLAAAAALEMCSLAHYCRFDANNSVKWKFFI
jgi:hypothetical protein